LFKDGPRTAHVRKKTKEAFWVNETLTQVALGVWVRGKPIYVNFDGGCCTAKRRTGLRLFAEHPAKGLSLLCTEVRENQRKRYAVGYEESRCNDLLLDFSGRQPFLRVSPGELVVHGQRQNPPFEGRFATVRGAVLQATDEGPTTSDLVEVRHFFCDT